jgi:uncharacterized membrane protein YeaQ/YmgE (transglycosylase-associated protein family)
LSDSRKTRMNIAARILLGALSGWLTGKALDGERVGKGQSPGRIQLFDIIYGIIGALMGDYLFFWIVIGRNSFGNYATAVLGAIALVGAARLVGARVHRSHQKSY